MSNAATEGNCNVMVRHDLSTQGQHRPVEYFFHSGREAERKAAQLRRQYPRCPAHVMLRGEVEAERRADEEYSRQDCS